MSIKVSAAFEVENDAHLKDLLVELRGAMLRLRLAPKYKVKVARDFENEEIGDGFPLDLAALGVADDEATPMERYITALTDADLGQHLTSVTGAKVEVSTNSLEQREGA